MKGLPPLCERCEELLREHFRARNAAFGRRGNGYPAPQHRQRAGPGSAADALNHLRGMPDGLCLHWPVPENKDYDSFRSALYNLARARGVRLHMLRDGKIVKLWVAAREEKRQ